MKKYILDGLIIEPNKAFEHNGLQYQANWTQLASDAEIAAIGMVEYVEPHAPPVIEHDPLEKLKSFLSENPDVAELLK